MNTSGKAKCYYDRSGNISGIRYHRDDRQEAIDILGKLAPKNSTIIGIDRGSGRCDLYVITDGHDARPRLQYISKYAGAVLDYTIWDSNKKSGIAFGYFDLGERIERLAELVHGDKKAYSAQEIR